LDGDRKSNSVRDRLRFLRGLGESYSDVMVFPPPARSVSSISAASRSIALSSSCRSRKVGGRPFHQAMI
jgi:hypothetical protein